MEYVEGLTTLDTPPEVFWCLLVCLLLCRALVWGAVVLADYSELSRSRQGLAKGKRERTGEEQGGESICVNMKAEGRLQ